ncbi:MAG: MobF family relaxase [Actinomycetota bacterium]
MSASGPEASPIPLVMLSIAKLAVGTEGYYLSAVADGLDDYYTGGGEASGRWAGRGAVALGLEGEVDSADLQALMAGLRPGTGLTPNGETLRAHPRRVPGFDLTFSAPKSLSVLFALGDPNVARAAIRAHETAVADAMTWLAGEAAYVRRGSNNARSLTAGTEDFGARSVPAVGFVSAEFRHRTSRAGDPQLHSHVLVANIARGPDGRWSALDAQRLYRAKMTAGALYRSTLRDQIHAQLGLEWTPENDCGVSEIAGIPRQVLEAFSKRRADIEDWLTEHGVSDAASAAAGAVATRDAKIPGSDEGLHERWIGEARELGWGPEHVDELLTEATVDPSPRRLMVEGCEVTEAGWFTHLADGLVLSTTTFDQRDAHQAIARALGTASVAEVEVWTARFLASAAVVTVEVDVETDMRRPAGQRRPEATVELAGLERALPVDRAYTARSLLRLEAQVLDAFDGAGGMRRGLPVVDHTVEGVIAGHGWLGPDQADAVRTLTGGRSAIAVMVGRPGTGKSTTLGVAADVWDRTGSPVTGIAPSARAAAELGDALGRPTRTVASWLLADQPIGCGEVVIVDEAGMVGTQDLAAIIDRTRLAGATLVLVGDHHQLPEVLAGGGFAAAVERIPEIAELTVNRRQRDPIEIEALEQLRAGNITAAVEAWGRNGQLTVQADPADVIAAVVADRNAAVAVGEDVIVLAGTRAQVRHLNDAIRSSITDQLGDQDLSAGGRSYAMGDRVVATRNALVSDPTTGGPARIINGTIATVTAIDPDRGHLDIVDVQGARFRLDAGYVTAHLDHGYATTVHKAQGVTCDRALVVGDRGLYRESAYVAMSRARTRSHLYLTTTEVNALAEAPHDRGLTVEGPDTPRDVLERRLGRSARQRLPLVADPEAVTIDTLARAYPQTELLALADRARIAEHEAGADRIVADAARVERTRWVRERITVGGRVHALDRGNVGLVLDLDDTALTATVAFTSENGNTARRSLPLTQIVPIDNPNAHPLPDRAVSSIEHIEQRLAERLTAANRALYRRRFRVGDAVRYQRAACLAGELAHAVLVADPPAWLTTALGDRPRTGQERLVWDDVAQQLTAWRTQHHITDPTSLLGPVEATGQPDQYAELARTVTATRAWLTRTSSAESAIEANPTRLLDRLDQLEELFATFPDRRSGLDALTHPTLDLGNDTDADRILRDAYAGPGTDRSRWILANWPHVIEANELKRTLRAHPTVRRLVTLAAHLHNHLGRIPPPLDPPRATTRDRGEHLARTAIVTRPRWALDLAHQHRHAPTVDLVDAITQEAMERDTAPAPTPLEQDALELPSLDQRPHLGPDDRAATLPDLCETRPRPGRWPTKQMPGLADPHPEP